MNNTKKLYHRKSTRLPDYDYKENGSYFITICTKDKKCLFGNIVDNKMELNNLGEVVKNEIIKTPRIRKYISIPHFVIMPNHVHAIINILDNSNVGAYGLRPLTKNQTKLISPGKNLGAVIRGLKSAVTSFFREIKQNKNIELWQRNYFEHIVRNEKSFYQIVEYIEYNPLNWKKDMFFL